MYQLIIHLIDGTKIEKSAAYSLKISTWLFDSWQRRSDTIYVELRDQHDKTVLLVDKRA